MAHSDRQHGIEAGVVSSIEAAMAARRAPTPAAPTPRAADQLLAAMRTVKAARFNAAERLERKHMLSLFAMSMVSLYFVGLSVWQAVYAPDPRRGGQPAHHAGLDHVVDLHAGAGPHRIHERLPHEGAPYARLCTGGERPLSRAEADAPDRYRGAAGVPPTLQRRRCAAAPTITRASTT